MPTILISLLSKVCGVYCMYYNLIFDGEFHVVMVLISDRLSTHFAPHSITVLFGIWEKSVFLEYTITSLIQAFSLA
jgi:hypothetical protein